MFAYVGCYTTPDRAGDGEGIGVYRVDPSTGEWTHLATVADVPNPSFLALHPRRHTLYCVHGGNDFSSVSAFAIDQGTGGLTWRSTESCAGTNPVSVDIDPDGRLAVVASYTGGSVTALPLEPDGMLRPLVEVRHHAGELGPDTHDQDGPHPHHIPYDRSARFLVVPDKGLDRLFGYRPDFDRGVLVPTEQVSVATSPGAGPRHITFHPNAPYAYVLNELNSTITTYDYDGTTGALTDRQTVSSLPPDCAVASTASEIAITASGRFLYASNRGHDSIATFAVSPAGDSLTPIGWEPSGGEVPRFFALDPAERFLYVANQDSSNIVTFRIDGDTGALTATGQIIATGSPSSIVFLD